MGKKSNNQAKDQVKYRAHRWFIGITFVMTFISAITGLGAIYWFYLDAIGIYPENRPFSRSAGIYFILLFIGYVVGLIGLLKPQPPLHHAATLASMLNVIISAILVFGAGNSQGLLLGTITSIHVYLAFRFPIDFDESGERFLSPTKKKNKK